MYKIEFLPIAKKDIDDIIYHISHVFKNITASKKLRDLFIDSLDKIVDFPYGLPIYKNVNNLENEYRGYKVKNYLMFYTINEKEKIITVVRVVYQKMNIENILE